MSTIFRTILALLVVGCLAARVSADEQNRSVNPANQVAQIEPASNVASHDPVAAIARTELPDGMSELPLMLLLGVCAIGLGTALMVATTRSQR